MKQFKFVILAATLIVFSQQAPAQGLGSMMYGGWGGGINVQAGDNTTRLGLDLGILNNPVFEGGLKIIREEAENSNLAATGIGPYISVYPVRQTLDFPVTIGIHSSINFLFFSGTAFDLLEAAGVELSGNELFVYGSVLHQVDINDRFVFMPEVEVGIARLELKAKSATDSETDSATDMFVGLAGRFVFESSPVTKVALVPQLRFSDGESFFRFSLILLLPN